MVESIFQSERLYLAFVCASRPSRGKEAAFPAETVEQLNEGFGSVMAARFAQPVGGELHGLFRAPDAKVAAAVLRGIAEISGSLTALRPSFGLGLGTLDSELKLDAIGLAGPCIDRARKAQKSARKGALWGGARGFGESRDHALTALLVLLGGIRSGWTRKQAGYALAARDKMQKDVAADFGVRPSVVCESLRSARFEEVRAGEQAVERMLAQAGSGFSGLFQERWRRGRATAGAS